MEDKQVGMTFAVRVRGGAMTQPQAKGEILTALHRVFPAVDVVEVLQVAHEGAKQVAFLKELEDLINRRSLESASNTPDFVLSEYLKDCLDAWNKSVVMRDKWHGFEPFNGKKMVK